MGEDYREIIVEGGGLIVFRCLDDFRGVRLFGIGGFHFRVL